VARLDDIEASVRDLPTSASTWPDTIATQGDNMSSPKHLARIAGVFYLLVGIFGGSFGVRDGLSPACT